MEYTSICELAIVTLCGEHADLFDADGLIEASDEEPIIILFVGMTAFKCTSVTRWHVNLPILEIADVRERSKHLPWCIELHSANQSRSEPTVSSIEEIAAFEPNDIMGECYKISSIITDVFITKGWYYISCKEYWKMVTLEDGVYKCPWCPTVIHLPRYRLIVGAVDTGSTDPLAAKFTDLYLFGPREETVVQKEDLHLFGPSEETVVRKEALLLVSSVQIVEPIVHANVVLREGVNCSAVGQDNVGIPAPETPKHVPDPAETSTLPLFMDLTPQTARNIFSFRY
nr:uncharacterized protein LOC127310462 [Lolium perenne]XP_051210880.1 uncharacterized protein LOC127328313 [Lolium perenne]